MTYKFERLEVWQLALEYAARGLPSAVVSVTLFVTFSRRSHLSMEAK